ncbi:MdtA/MuxA family multidrug efflux RND transporter periplasmic adaptor subunit [Metapseudomonas furukawaii]|uniref:Probable Co/Zn/Cd efflux system membrane fusion protein n=1 Tax=Metapseudomonas furukawaii TaxID=1149133 RepID=A0AAD1BZN1_METFU|nr:MdtA/MuxA family multidrug efflux RND transporter periplasmic adaptor subunit [Pseudomonas furukawaii]ELS25115.1 putative Co/Zn/Cd efflux system membrane fusion protein [Pseudomonas furukawaii]BAU74228.1 probable Co/Zn/Cd efflux system membrane fusion protein [Pseudomonas furukawaii]
MSPNTLQNPKSRSLRNWLLLAVALAALIALIWWLWPEAAGKSAQQAGRGGPGRPGFGAFSGPVPVRVAPITQGDFPVYLKALGTVTALNTVNVRGRVDGELVKLEFEEGQQVKAGDLLAVIDPRPYQVALQQAEGTLAQNRAQLKNAEIDLARYRGLYAEDSIAKQTLDTQEALVAQYRGTIKTNEAAVAEARLNLGFTQVRAPISGRLGLRQVDLGNLVSSGDTTPLVVITQTRPISVAFTLPEGQLPAVVSRYRAGETLVVEAWDRDEKVKQAEGVLQSLDNQIDTTTGTLKLKARFANQDETLFPNQFVNVRLRAELLSNAVLIPSAAVQFGSEGTFAYVMDGEKKVRVRKLETGPDDGQRTVVRSGLEPGDRVVLEGTDRLRDGAEVEVVHDAEQIPTAPAEQLQGQRPEGRERNAGEKKGGV